MGRFVKLTSALLVTLGVSIGASSVSLAFTTQQFTIPAHISTISTSFDTGISLTAREHFPVTVPVDELWSAGVPPRTSNADGLGPNPPHTYSDYDWGLYNAFRYQSHLRDIDDGRYSFAETSAGVAPISGNLKLTDNTGSDAATASPTPIPAVAWLMGSGLLGFVGLRRRSG